MSSSTAATTTTIDTSDVTPTTTQVQEQWKSYWIQRILIQDRLTAASNELQVKSALENEAREQRYKQLLLSDCCFCIEQL